jgi:periplasmic protein TonB
MTSSSHARPLAPEIRAQKTGLRAWADARFPRLSLPLSYEWEAGIVSAGLHVATLVLVLALVVLHLPPPPDQTVVEVIPEAPPQGEAQPQATPPVPQPPQPKPKPMASTAQTPDTLPLPPPAAPPHPAPPRPAPQPQARTQGSHVPAPHRGTQEVAVTRPAAPDANNVVPDYSQQARMAGEQGEVHFVVYITPWGSVSNVVITSGSGYADLDDNARMAALQWHFRPAQINGKPVASTLKLWVRFETQ